MGFALWLTAWPVSASSMATAETTETNVLLADLASGQYLERAMTWVIDGCFISIVKNLPLEFLSANDEAERFFRREATRHNRRLMSRQMARVGFSNPLSSGGDGGIGSENRKSYRKEPVTLRAKISPRRLGLSFSLRF